MRDSILVCAFKELGVPYLIAKATDELHAKVLRKVGVDRVVFPERDMGMRLAKSLLTPNVLELIDLSDDYQLIEIILPARRATNDHRSGVMRRKCWHQHLAIHRGGQFNVSLFAGLAVPDRGYPAARKKDDIESIDQ